MKDFKYFIFSIALVTALLVVVNDAFGQSNQYQRPGKKAASAEIKPADASKAQAPVATKDAKGEKLDIQQIESEYWQQKDTEFHVVQNRRYAKEKRFYVSAATGPVINDGFSRGLHTNVAGGYYFKEQHGVEVSYSDFGMDDSKTTKELLALGAKPNHNKSTYQFGATYNWMPIYGKISLFDSSIIYFDMGLLAGIGLAGFEQEKEGGNTKDSSPMLILDISQQFFISNHFAFRFDVKNRFYKQDVKGWRVNNSSTKSDTEHNLSATFGLILYF